MRVDVARLSPAAAGDWLAASEAALVAVPVRGPIQRAKSAPELVDFRGAPALAALDRHVGGLLSRACAAGTFSGRRGDRLEGHSDGSAGPERVLFLGLGSESSPDSFREAAGKAVKWAESQGASSFVFCAAGLAQSGQHGSAGEPEQAGVAVAEGLVLASWRFLELKSDSPCRTGPPQEGEAKGAPLPVEQVTVLVEEALGDAWTAGVRRGIEYAEAENLARTLQARPGNVATPSHLADEARKIAEDAGLECTVFGPAEIEAERMGALLSVARGSSQEPRFVILRHSGGRSGEPPLVLVGKGLTFDAGGISIKPAKGMEDMKYDMSGGAAVLGAMRAIGRLRLPVHVVGIVPSCENLLNGAANKPGDVVITRAGKSVEVINTDAEGRLILADALDYAAELKPAAVVDCATLTGACVVALGRHLSAVLGNDQDLIEEVRSAGHVVDQPCWQLPLGPAYRRQLDSDFADLKNVGGREAGTITAACFLAEFAQGVPWAHLDIAGTAYGKTTKPYLRKGPLGNPCRLLVQWVVSRASR